MTTAQLSHFVVRNVTFTITAAGVQVVCYSNNSCHLWLRWTNIVPQKHVNTVIVRGAPMGTYIDQCFVVYTDVEQQEPGDTWTHTFILEPWPVCETRWFYFWGTVGGILSPSRSAIFSYHRLTQPTITTIRLYTAPGRLGNAVDGETGYMYSPLNWSQIHGGPGNIVNTGDPYTLVIIMFWAPPGYFLSLRRAHLTFNLATIPPASTIISARLVLTAVGKLNDAHLTAAYNIVQSYCQYNNDLVIPDYQRCNTVPFSIAKSYDSIILSVPQVFDLNANGLATLIPGAYAKFAVRESNYDIPNIQPGGTAYSQCSLYWGSADNANPAVRPYLEITYLSP